MNESIIKAARELGQLIVASEEYEKARDTMDELNNNAEAVALIEGYNVSRAEKTEGIDVDSLSDEEARELNDSLQEDFNLILDNPVVKEYVKAQSDYEKMVNSVNAILKFYISGRSEQEENSDGCGGNCSGCSGCH